MNIVLVGDDVLSTQQKAIINLVLNSHKHDILTRISKFGKTEKVIKHEWKALCDDSRVLLKYEKVDYLVVAEYCKKILLEFLKEPYPIDNYSSSYFG